MHQLRLRVQLRLNHDASRLLEKQGVSVTTACEQMLQRMIATGLSRMEVQKALEREDKLRLAEEHLLSCIKMMVEQAQTLGSFPVVDEDAFEAALKKLCPLWPFC